MLANHRFQKSTRRLALIALLLLLTSMACNLPNLGASGVGGLPGINIPISQPDAHGPLATVPANATTTPTPFLPAAPTNIPTATVTPNAPTATPTELPLWGEYPGPSVAPDVQILPPVDLLNTPDDQVNIMLLGSDQRPASSGFRTDVMMLVSITPSQNQVSVVSFPRDLYVYVPGWTTQRINTAFPHGGLETLDLTMAYNFGVHIDHYLLVNFGAFQQIVDSLGGINVYVGYEFTDHRDGYGDYTVGPGNVSMDGETALWYVRSRYTTSDLDRIRRQQDVLEAIFYKFLSLNGIARAPELFDTYRRNTQTDMSFGDIAALVPVGALVGASGDIDQYLITGSDVTGYRVPATGAAVLLPNRETILPKIAAATLAQ